MAMRVAQKVTEMGVWNLAEQMIVRGARPPLVISSTNLPREAIRDMYQSIHGKRPPSGLLPDSSISLLRRTKQVAQASIFFHCYKKIAEGDIFSTMSAQDVLRAHDFYIRITDGHKDALDFSFAWFIARDIRSRIIEAKFCSTCQVDHLYSVRNHLTHQCPFCRIFSN